MFIHREYDDSWEGSIIVPASSTARISSLKSARSTALSFQLACHIIYRNQI